MFYQNAIRFHHSDEHGAGEAHSHEHHRFGPVSAEKAKALMSYMIDHNAHHAEEIRELKGSVGAEAALLMEQAAKTMTDSIVYLQDALKLIQED